MSKPVPAFSCHQCGATIEPQTIPARVVAYAAGRIRQSHRKAPYVAGPGRPKCTCGECPACLKRARAAQ